MAYIAQGSFVSTGATKLLELPYGVDYLEIDNYTTLAAGGAATGVSFEWQRGYTADYGIEYTKLAADESITKVVITTGGFTEYKSSDNPVGALNATITAVTAAATPLVELTNTHLDNIKAGDVVRMIGVTGAHQLGGIDFTVDTVTLDTSFELAYMAQIVAGTTGSLRKIKYAPLFYPAVRTITKISKAASAVVTMSVTHEITVGQKVSFRVPADFDMVEMDGLEGTVTAIDTANNTITVDIDSTGFTTFAWPLTADGDFTPAQVVPIGKDTHEDYAGTFSDARRNNGTMGMILAAGTHSPAGVNDDVIYWRAYKSDNV